MLAVRLGNQEALRRLARPRLMNLLERYRAQLQQACELYNGHLHTLQRLPGPARAAADKDKAHSDKALPSPTSSLAPPSPSRTPRTRLPSPPQPCNPRPSAHP